MSSRVTLSRVIGLVFLVAALGSGYGSASAATGPTVLGPETPLGLKADGLRWQAKARAYADRPAASFFTPQALKADGLRWQAKARAYANRSAVSRSNSSDFDWGSAAIGGAGTMVLVLGAGLVVFAVRRVRHTRPAV
jgi:hypothetical protein